MPQRPAIVLVHGFWSGAAHWGPVIKELHKHSYPELHAVEIPLTSLADDAERTRKMVTQIRSPVILVGHSYGGVVISEMGNLPNVRGLVYVSGFAPDTGESVGLLSAASPPAAFEYIVPDSDGYLWLRQDKYHESFCQDLPEDDALVMSATQKAPQTRAFADAVTFPAWREKPVWYQVSTHDRMIDPQSQEVMAFRTNPKRVTHVAASHASLISHPEEIADLIDEASTESGF